MIKKIISYALASLACSTLLFVCLEWQFLNNVSISLGISVGLACTLTLLSLLCRPFGDITMLSAFYMLSRTGRSLTMGFVFAMVIGGPLINTIQYVGLVDQIFQCNAIQQENKEGRLKSTYSLAHKRMTDRINQSAQLLQDIDRSVESITTPLLGDVTKLAEDYKLLSSISQENREECIVTLNDMYQHCSRKVAAVKEYCEDIINLSQSKAPLSQEEVQKLDDAIGSKEKEESHSTFARLLNVPMRFCQQLEMTMRMCQPLKSGEKVCATIADPYKSMVQVAKDTVERLAKVNEFFNFQNYLSPNSSQHVPLERYQDGHSDNSCPLTDASAVSVIVLKAVRTSVLIVFFTAPVLLSIVQYKSSAKQTGTHKHVANEATLSDVLHIFGQLLFSASIFLLERLVHSSLSRMYKRNAAKMVPRQKLQSMGEQLLGENVILFKTVQRSSNVSQMLMGLIRYIETVDLLVEDIFSNCIREPANSTSTVWIIVTCLLYATLNCLLFAQPMAAKERKKLLCQRESRLTEQSA